MLETIVGWRFDLLNSQLFTISEEKTQTFPRKVKNLAVFL